jgi:hypothetical protein
METNDTTKTEYTPRGYSLERWIVTLLSLLFLPFALRAQETTTLEQNVAGGDQPRMVFAVWTTHSSPNDPALTRIEPIARLRRVAFAPNRVEFTKPPAQKDVIKDYYQPGAKYDVFRGGVHSGTVSVLPGDNWGCQPIERGVTRSGQPTPHWRSADAVAGESLVLAHRKSPLRAATDAEMRELLAIVRRVFAIKAVPADALANIKSENVAATDLNGDGRTDFIGSFVVRDPRNSHDLFLVAMRDGRGILRADVIRYDRALNAKDDTGAKNWTLVDVEDFDGDGIDEIIVEAHGWEWNSYDILKWRREAEWEVIYSGGGSGC